MRQRTTTMVASVLTQAVIPVVKLARPDDSPLLTVIIEEAVAVHGLDGESAPPWMVAWFNHIATGQPRPTLFEVPIGYPRGDCGLVNLLMDIEETVGSLGFIEEGESFKWTIPAAHLTVLSIRETGASDVYYGAMRPIESDTNSWLRDQYRHLDQGDSLEKLA